MKRPIQLVLAILVLAAACTDDKVVEKTHGDIANASSSHHVLAAERGFHRVYCRGEGARRSARVGRSCQ